MHACTQKRRACACLHAPLTRLRACNTQAIAARRQANVVAGEAALDSARTKLATGDHAGARAALVSALKAFKTAGVVEKPELQQLDLDIAAREREAEVEAVKAREEQEAQAAREAAAKAAAFKAEAEEAAKRAKEEADAKRAAEDAARAEEKEADAAKARQEAETRAAADAAAAEEQAEAERRAAAAAFAEKKRREKEAKEAAAATSTPAAQPAAAQLHGSKADLVSTPVRSSLFTHVDSRLRNFAGADDDAGASPQAQIASSTSSSSLTGPEAKPPPEGTPPIAAYRHRAPSAVQILASPGPRPSRALDRNVSVASVASSVQAVTGSPEDVHGLSSPEVAQSPSESALSFAALQDIQQPEPQLWAALLGHLEDAGDSRWRSVPHCDKRSRRCVCMYVCMRVCVCVYM